MANPSLFKKVNDRGQTLLHVAVGDGHNAGSVQQASQLLAQAANSSDSGEEKLLWALDNEKKTALHYACQSKNLKLVQELLRGHSNSFEAATLKPPIHIPHAIVGRVHSLLATVMRDAAGSTRDTATSYSIVKELMSHSVGNPLQFFPEFFEYFEDLPLPQARYQLEDAVPIVVLGDHNSGKSTFIKSLQINSAFAKLYHFFVNVQKEDTYRAGVIPTHVESKSFGRIVFYEFSGHREFVHEAILECGQLADALFVVIVNLKDEYYVLRKQIEYWFSFIQYHHSKIPSETARPPNVLLVGSHQDYFKFGRILAPHDRLLYAFLSVRSKFRFNYTTSLPPAMDCRKSSAHIVQLSWTMWYELQNLRTGRQAIPSQCYLLYGMLQKLHTDKGNTCVTIDRLVQSVTSGDKLYYKLLSSQKEWILKKIRCLHDLNVLVFLENKEKPGSSWVVTNPRSLLHHIDKAISGEPTGNGSQGVLSHSEVVDLFQKRIPEYDAQQMVKVMLHFKYCCCLKESKNLNNHYFFPHLLEDLGSEELRAMVKLIKDDCCMFAWASILKKAQACQFFKPHLIHTLLLEVPRRFAPSDCRRMLHTVYWTDARRGVQVVFHISANRAIVLNMKAATPAHAYTLECLKLRNAIIHSIRDVLEMDGTPATEEFFIPSSYPTNLFPVFDLDDDETVVYCSLEKVTNAVKDKLLAIPSTQQIPCFKMADVLVFEPYYSISDDLLQELATAVADPIRGNSVIDQQFFANVLEHLRGKRDEDLKLFLTLLEVPSSILASIERKMTDATWIFRLYEYIYANDFSYLKLQRTLDSISFIKLHKLHCFEVHTSL